MILVTGAAGKTGKAIIQALAERGATVRALVRHPEQTEEIKRIGAYEAAVADLSEASALAQAMTGVQAVYLICPNVHPQEAEIGRLAVQAAQNAGVRHLVYHSVLHPQVEAMPHHWQKMRVEEMLFASGIPYTILQACAYMQNILGMWESITTRGIYRVPYNVEARLSIVDLQDVAEVSAKVLTEPGHENAIYELAGPQALSQVEVAGTLSKCLGYHVSAQTIPLDEWQRNSGLTGYALEALSAMFRYYDQHGLVGNPGVLTQLLGRPPTDLRTFIERENK